MDPLNSISIPQPCHENWNHMMPNEKGRFCNSCRKTVFDFTQMCASQIKNILHENRSNRICGRIKKEQLASINLYIPSQVLKEKHDQHKLFLLILLIVMGTSLMNCTNKNGQKQKIDSVEVIDSPNKHVYNAKEKKIKNEEDSINKLNCSTKINIISKREIKRTKDVIVMGEMLNTTGLNTENDSVPFINVEFPPEFKNTPQHLSAKEKRNYFNDEVAKFVLDNFGGPQLCFDSPGTHRIQSEFVIDSLGFVKDIKVRVAFEPIEKEIMRVLKKLPQFIPAKQNDKNVSTIYNIPIVFKTED